MTLSEVLLWNQLKQKKMRGYDFDRQRPIDNYIVDFYCKDLMLAIEIDGISHDIGDAPVKDEIRQKKLETLSVQFLRFDDREVKYDMNNVLLEIDGWIEEFERVNPGCLPGRISPTPNPSRESNEPTPNPSKGGE